MNEIFKTTIFVKDKGRPDKTFRVISIDYLQKRVLMTDGGTTYYGSFDSLEVANTIPTNLLKI